MTAALDAAFAAIEEFALARMAAYGPPAMTIAVTDRDETLWSAAYGVVSLDTQQPVGPQSLFQIGSVGKSFTALLVMQEIEAGCLQTGQQLEGLLPWFDVRVKMKPITLHDLLTHTSGLSSGTEAHEAALAEVWTMRAFDPGTAPGSQFRYSNLAYKLVGLMLERLTGQRYADLVASRIFEPAQMTSSVAEITQAIRPSTVVGYNRLFADRIAHTGHPWAAAPFLESDSADGCISSTSEDMARYTRVILNGGAAAGGRLISPESFEMMTRGYHVDPEGEHGDAYGYGLFEATIEGHRTIGHDGGMIAHQASLRADVTAGIGSVVLGSGPEIHRVAAYALDVLRDAAGGQPPRPAPSADPRVIANGESLAGTWACGTKTLILTPSGAGVTTDVGATGEQVWLEERGPANLVIPFPPLDRYLLHIGRDASGQVLGLDHGPDRYERAGMEGYAPKPREDWAPLYGHYRSTNPWMSDIRVYARSGKLYLQSPLTEEEQELIPLADGRNFRVGEEDGSPDRLRFEGVVQGKTLVAWYLNCPFGRIASP